MDTQGELNGYRLDPGTGNQLGDVSGEHSKPPPTTAEPNCPSRLSPPCSDR